ncbi:MAG: FRG domain-containing protein, partial [Candidatus Thiodiazotropha sp.]
QESVFTLSGELSKPLETVAPNAFKCFQIPLEARSGAEQFLKLAGVNEFRLFPDLDGLARFINES